MRGNLFVSLMNCRVSDKVRLANAEGDNERPSDKKFCILGSSKVARSISLEGFEDAILHCCKETGFFVIRLEVDFLGAFTFMAVQMGAVKTSRERIKSTKYNFFIQYSLIK